MFAFKIHSKSKEKTQTIFILRNETNRCDANNWITLMEWLNEIKTNYSLSEYENIDLICIALFLLKSRLGLNISFKSPVFCTFWYRIQKTSISIFLFWDRCDNKWIKILISSLLLLVFFSLISCLSWLVALFTIMLSTLSKWMQNRCPYLAKKTE